jgi:hypothetical protein
MDHWEGQQPNRSPGNIYSKVEKLHLDGSQHQTVTLSLTEMIPLIAFPVDTDWVKHIRIQSKILSEFWGQPMFLGAVVLLPRGYNDHKDVRYPVIYVQNHFSEDPAFGFTLERKPDREEDRPLRNTLGFETGHEFSSEWTSDDFPRMIAVTFQHPTPYYDDSYAVNSANMGPYGDAIMTELVPFLEEHFRIIREPYARILTGGSTGGWAALALQLFHPDFFGGAWVLYPDPVDFRRFGSINIYDDDNAFTLDTREWAPSPERFFLRDSDGQPLVTIRQLSQFEEVLGSRSRSGFQLAAWEAVFGPVSNDGYPKPLWDKATGRIDHETAKYMRAAGYDLRDYTEKRWKNIGPSLVGKLHFYCGDMDNFYLNLATYLMEDLLRNTKEPYYGGSFEYGRPEKGHGWQPMTNGQLIRTISRDVESHQSKGRHHGWKYD